MSNLRGWEDLPDGLLHSIVELLGSFPDLLAFVATCHPWRSALSSYPSKSTLYTLFPPLFLNPNVSSPRPFPNAVRNTSVPNRSCYVIDLASQEDTSLCSQVPLLSNDYKNNRPPSNVHKFAFKGASFGHMIFSSNHALPANRTCFLFDVLTGIEVSPPPLLVDENPEFFDYGTTFTGPLASPKSHLIVFTLSSNFFWRVGSDSWSKCSRPCNGSVTQFVIFKGHVFGMGLDSSLFMVHLNPQIRLQEIPVSWGGRNSMTNGILRRWPVVCGDMLLMVGCHNDYTGRGSVFEAYRLDTLTEPAKWVKVERLENWAIFISNDKRVQPLSCLNPERWGGRSNCVYCYDLYSGHLVALELGRPLPEDDATKFNKLFYFPSFENTVQPLWMVPSISLCCDGQ